MSILSRARERMAEPTPPSPGQSLVPLDVVQIGAEEWRTICQALTYISAPTIGFCGPVDHTTIALEGDEAAVRRALVCCINTARQAGREVGIPVFQGVPDHDEASAPV